MLKQPFLGVGDACRLKGISDFLFPCVLVQFTLGSDHVEFSLRANCCFGKKKTKQNKNHLVYLSLMVQMTSCELYLQGWKTMHMRRGRTRPVLVVPALLCLHILLHSVSVSVGSWQGRARSPNMHVSLPPQRPSCLLLADTRAHSYRVEAPCRD